MLYLLYTIIVALKQLAPRAQYLEGSDTIFKFQQFALF